MSSRRVRAASLLIGLIGLIPWSPARAAPPQVEIILGHTQPQDPARDPAAAMADAFKRAVETQSCGRIRIQIFPDGMLGGNRDTTRLVKNGVIQTAFVTTGGLAPLYPPIGVLQQPFLFASADSAESVFDGPFGRHLAEDIEARTGLRILGFGNTGGAFIVTNSRRPIRSVGDFNGLKIRTIPGSEVLNAMILALGATPVKISSRDELTALSAGIADGQMSPAMQVLGQHYDEAQKYATLTNHLTLPYVWIFNGDAFARFSSEDQAILRQAARGAIVAGRETARRIEASENGLPLLRQRMVVTDLPPDERERMKALVQPRVREALLRTVGEDGFRFLNELEIAAGTAR